MQKSRILNLCRIPTLSGQNPEGQSRLSHYFNGAIWKQVHKISKVLVELISLGSQTCFLCFVKTAIEPLLWAFTKVQEKKLYIGIIYIWED